MKVLYIITMAVAFSNLFNGVQTWYYWKIIIPLLWTGLWLVDIMRTTKRIDEKIIKYIKMYVVPWILIVAWSLLIWGIVPPEHYNSSYCIRMFSNILMLILIIFNGISASYFFGKDVIRLTVYAIFTAIFANMIVVVPQYGLGMFVVYLKNLLIEEAPYGSALASLSSKMEIQAPTMAIGIFLIYYLFFEKDMSKKQQKRIIILLIIGAYLGFKRTVVFALLLTVVGIFAINRYKNNVKKSIYLVASFMYIACFSYVFIVKYNVLGIIADYFNLNTMGRVDIYRELAKTISFSPLFMGNGFGYASKYLFETIGFVTHSEIIRMLSDIGLIPYVLWLYHYLINIPKQMYKYFGKKVCQAVLLVTLYVFSTYFMENNLVTFCLQYSFIIVPMGMTAEQKTKHKVKIVV